MIDNANKGILESLQCVVRVNTCYWIKKYKESRKREFSDFPDVPYDKCVILCELLPMEESSHHEIVFIIFYNVYNPNICKSAIKKIRDRIQENYSLISLSE